MARFVPSVSSSAAALLLIALAAAPVSASAATHHTTSRSSSSSSSRSSSSNRYSSAARREMDKLKREDIEESITVPVLFEPLGSFGDTWGQARSEGRTHEGTDILAPRGTPIVSPTDAVVTRIGVDTLGGNSVETANPGGESYYFAHLDSYADGIKVCDVLAPGDVIGYVGNTGDAAGGPTHLHFGIYKDHAATNPFPRLTQQFAFADEIGFVGKMLDDADHEADLADQLVTADRSPFVQAQAQGITLPDAITDALARSPAPVTIGAGTSGLDLDVGSSGDRVILLQSFLITQNSGTQAQALARAGATGLFGPLTKAALAEFQSARGITPASGYFGPTTRAFVAGLGTSI